MGVLLLALGCSDDTPTYPVPTPSYNTINSFPAWSPDGSRILYESRGISGVSDGAYVFDPDSAGLWIINADGTDPRLLLQAWGVYADWSPGGEWIAFEADKQIHKGRFVGSELDTTSLVQLTSEGRNYFPTWSPDGEWISYDSDSSDPQAPYQIWKMRSDGTDRVNVSHSSARMPDWSPDGQWIVHMRYVDLDGEIFSMDASGDSLVQLTANRRSVRHPKYSPDGTLIAFQSDGGIWVMGADGDAPRKIANGYEPSWSPNGEKIAFSRPSDDPKLNGTIWIMNADGTNLRQLTPGLP